MVSKAMPHRGRIVVLVTPHSRDESALDQLFLSNLISFEDEEAVTVSRRGRRSTAGQRTPSSGMLHMVGRHSTPLFETISICEKSHSKED